MRSLLRQITLKILATRQVQFFLSRILPRIRFSTSPPKITGNEWQSFVAMIRPGDLVFSVDRSKLSSVLIPGEWDHVGIVSEDAMIVEAHYPKVRKIHPFDFCHTSDAVGVLRPLAATASILSTKCDRFIGIGYDTLFRKGAESLYCSELVWQCDQYNTLGFDTSDAVGLGIEYLSPDGLWDSKNIVGRARIGDSDGI